MKPILKYRGGKGGELSKILPLIPQYATYIEPFFGGGALFWKLSPPKAVIGDRSGHLMRFYRQLRDESGLVLKEIESLLLRYAEKPRMQEKERFYYAMRELYNQPEGKLTTAALFYFLNKTCYAGLLRYNRRGAFNVPFGKYKSIPQLSITPEHIHLLQRSKLVCGDYTAAMQGASSDDFIFLDPPYDATASSYENPFDACEQERLAMDFKNLSCPALMIIGKTKLTEKLYKKYIVGAYGKTYTVNEWAKAKNKNTHLIIKNYSSSRYL